MNATIYYKLSETGRKASLLAGGNGRMEQSISGEITAEDLELFHVDAQGNITLQIEKGAEYNYGNSNTVNFYGATFDAPYASIAEAITAYRAIMAAQAEKIAELKAKEQAEVAAKRATAEAERATQSAAIDVFLANPILRSSDQYISEPGQPRIWISSNHPRYVEFAAERDRRNAGDEEMKRAEAEAKAAEEARRAEAKAAQIAAWVETHGDENQKERLAAGLLPQREITEAMEAAAFASLAAFALYEKITAGDVRATCRDACCAYENCAVDYGASNAPDATEAEFEGMRRIRTALPGATVMLREHWGRCDDVGCDPDEGVGYCTRRGIYVKVVDGAFTWNREFAAE